MSAFGDDSVVIPDLPTPITAYRGWDLFISAAPGDIPRPTLGGIGGTVWPTDAPITAAHTLRSGFGGDLAYGADHCPASPSPAETDDTHVGHGCGIYGYKTVEQVAVHGERIRVWGEVQLWGTTYEHDGGWRATHGRPLALYRPVLDTQPTLEQVEAVAEAYGIPVVDMPDDLPVAAAVRRRRDLAIAAAQRRAEHEASMQALAAMFGTSTAAAVAGIQAVADAIAAMPPPPTRWEQAKRWWRDRWVVVGGYTLATAVLLVPIGHPFVRACLAVLIAHAAHTYDHATKES